MLKVDDVLARYAQILSTGGLALAAVALLRDDLWINAWYDTAILVAAITLLRSAPIRLSKYSFLTQGGIAVLTGSIVLGPSPVVFALTLGVLGADVLWLRKPLRAGMINAGREVIAFLSAFGCYAAVLRLSGTPGLSLDFLPAAFTLAGLYFLTTRALFYFTLLLRNKLQTPEQLLIIRWEVVSYVLTLAGSIVVIGALHALSPAGWIAVLIVLMVIGMLSKRILEDAIAAEDLNKVHLMETKIASNVSLDTSFEQIERLAYRLLDWGDFRICRVSGTDCLPVYRGTLGGAGRASAGAETTVLRQEALLTGRPVTVRNTARDARVALPVPGVQSMLVCPVRFGDDMLGTIEIDHYKRHAYGPMDIAALLTLAGQVATAIHIAELRRPLINTVEKIGNQVDALARATESLRASGAALTSASAGMRQSAAEQEAFVSGGLEATRALVLGSQEMAEQGARAAETSHSAADVAARNRAVIDDAIRRLVHLKMFVADSSQQVAALGDVTRRITSFIGSIQEIADLTSLIALNASIEAARAGQEGKGFAVVADEVRDLAAQSRHAAREAGGLVAAVSTQVESVIAQMERGRDVVAGVEELSADAGRALDAIARATGEAGEHAGRIARTAASQVAEFDRLAQRIGQVASVSKRTRTETDELAEEAIAAAEGQADLERAIRELGGVATDLQVIARHFAVGA